MNRLDVIPYPRSVEFLEGEVCLEGLDIDSLTAEIDSRLGEEEYALTVKPDFIGITAGSAKGEFYAKQTLRMLGGKCRSVYIEDKPEYEYRGFMLDTVRHIVSLEDTKRFIDAAASVKMNVMHWHITDDQGWRLELESHPEITEGASVRHGSNFGMVCRSEEDYAGYFTKEEMREIVRYCDERFITVIPEVDMPGHMTALLCVHPELSCAGGNIEVETRQGVFPNILCAGKDKTFEVVFDILRELMDIFPSKKIHIGGDEAPKKRWRVCPDCQRRIWANSLKDEEELQGWFVNKIIEFLHENGREAIVWNESLNSGIVKDAIVQQWMDKTQACALFANNGGKVIASDFFHCYADYPYGMTPLKKTYSYRPRGKLIDNKSLKNIIGVEATLWTEFIDNSDRLFYQAFPRFTAIAEIGWTSEMNLNEKDFERRFALYRNYLYSLGITPADSSEWNPAPFGRAKRTLKFFVGNFNPKAVNGYE